MSSEIIFQVTEADEGGYVASALGYGIHTQAEILDELRTMVRDAVACYFDDPSQAPRLIRLHFVRDETLAVSGCLGMSQAKSWRRRSKP
jgi:hypothetical protein